MSYLDAIFSQYLLGLGEFDLLSSEATIIHPLLYVYFIIGTLITQIILVNGLIALLADTYSRIMEKKSLRATIGRMQIYNDFFGLNKLS